MTTLIEPVFAVGGAVGQHMQQLDWAATALGPVASWHPNLKSALSICLECPEPMAIYWGSELILLHNDGFRTILGAKYPATLGQPARTVFPEIWYLIQDDFIKVMEGGRAFQYKDQQLPMVRHGYIEEGYFNYSFSPIRSPEGMIAGTFVTATETTYRVLGERRTSLLDELAQRTTQAADAAGACDAALDVLEQGVFDAAFVLVYRMDDRRTQATLHGSRGLREHPKLRPELIDLTAVEDLTWPLAQVCQGHAAQVSIPLEQIGPGPLGPWPERPGFAMVLPLRAAGAGSEVGFLILGLSPRLSIDAAYRGFCSVASLAWPRR